MIKSIFDVTVSIVLSILLLPILLILGLLLLVMDGRPIFFIQPRVGLNGKIFNIIKFRTMKAGKQDPKLDCDRLTKIGKTLRDLSLDELPEIINVIKGDMSLVGPRPLLVEYLPRYNQFQAQRHLVKPGITGLAQVNGRNNTDWDKRFELDVWYAFNHTFMLDVKILVKTVIKVLLKQDIYKDNNITMDEFGGDKPSGIA